MVYLARILFVIALSVLVLGSVGLVSNVQTNTQISIKKRNMLTALMVALVLIGVIVLIILWQNLPDIYRTASMLGDLSNSGSYLKIF